MVESTSSMRLCSAEISTSKYVKHCRMVNGDIISNLPDALLCHILYFLPTICAIRTSILSKRWRYLWTSVASFDFDDELIVGCKKFRGSLDFGNTFMDFLDRVLILRGALSVRKFYLKCSGEYNSSRLTAWLRAARMPNVEELDLSISIYEGTIQLPWSLFGCEKLVILKLHSKIEFAAPVSANFPCLKILHLRRVHCSDDIIGKLISGSLALEEFVFHGGYEYGGQKRTLYLQSSSLKSLTIRQTNYYSKIRVAIDTPYLEFLELKKCSFEVRNMIPLSALVEANINVDRYCEDAGFMVVQLLRQISNVKFLHLSNHTLDTIRAAVDNNDMLDLNNLLTFHNLTRLEVRGSYREESLRFPEILKCTPRLNVLVINKCTWWDIDRLKSAPPCFWLCLEVVELKGFHGWSEEMQTMGYLLENATVLKKITISFDATSYKKESDVLKKLLVFPRASSSCQIAFF